MADIRINSLPTTASASSSDDFLALDGATNGTRKLNAYSPTFGGNLTVSGNSTLGSGNTYPIYGYSGYFQFTGSTAGKFAAAGTYRAHSGAGSDLFSIQLYNGSAWSEAALFGSTSTTITGNLTVSGTGTSSFAGSLQANGGASQSVNTPALRIGNDKILVWLDSSSTTTNAGFLWYDSSNILRIGAENATRIQVTAATTTISNNLTVSGGQIALAASSSTPSVLITQTDSAGYSIVRLLNTGGTAQSYDFAVGGSGTGSLAQKFYIYDNTAGVARLAIAPTSGNVLLGTTTDSGLGRLQVSGAITATEAAGTGLFGFFGGAALVSGTLGAQSFILRTNNTAALTLDSSQNATFAGRVATGGAASIGVAASTGLGLNVNLDPGTLTYGAADAWLGARIRPARAGTTGNAFAIAGQLEVTSGTQTKAATIMAEAPSGTITNHTYFYANSSGSRVAPTGNYSLYAESTAGPAYIGDATASTSTTTGALQVAGGVGVAGAANVGTYYGMVDGVTAPAATSGYAKIYVDTADGDLKVIFGDGTIKTIATDT